MAPETTPDSISIAICTRDRASALAQTLESMRSVEVPADVHAEVLVIDNNSTDETPKLTQQTHIPQFALRHIVEPRPGVAHCRNRAIRESRSAVILYADDDVRPEPDWLRAHLSAFANPDVAAVQGRSQLAFESEPPAWYDPACHGAPGLVDRGTEPIFPYEKPLITLNAAVRADVARHVGGFHTMLGPGRAGVYEDDDFSLRLMRAGYRQRYEPGALVTHVLPGERLTAAALRRRAFNLGVSLHIAAVFYGTAEARRPYLDLARWSWRRLKMEIKHAIKGGRGVLPQTERFQAIAAGGAWAAWQGRRRLAARFGPEGGLEEEPGERQPEATIHGRPAEARR